jgi:hypothetical protein
LRRCRSHADMTAKDIKTFKLKARGDAGAGKSELLLAFAIMLRQFGMTTEVCGDDHHIVVTATKAQRNALYAANRRHRATVTESGPSTGT